MGLHKDKKIAIIYYLILRKRILKKKKVAKRYWVHPLTALRPIEGFFYVWYNDLRIHDKKFFGYFQMTIQSFDNLLHTVGPFLRYSNTSWRNAISPEERLSVTLR